MDKELLRSIVQQQVNSAKMVELAYIFNQFAEATVLIVEDGEVIVDEGYRDVWEDWLAHHSAQVSPTDGGNL